MSPRFALEVGTLLPSFTLISLVSDEKTAGGDTWRCRSVQGIDASGRPDEWLADVVDATVETAADFGRS